jgi:phage terminase large subunit-like protein
MSPEDRYAAESIVRELERRKQRNRIDTFYATQENRAGYPVHMAFFEAGKVHRERLVLAGNRCGKTEGIGGYETVLHLTGRYPDWWPGRRFDKPVSWWVGGDTATTVRDIIQYKLLGKVGDFGTGLIPGECLIDTSNKRGVPDAVENIYIKYAGGGRSVCQMKSYDQGREAWQGTEQHGVWLDEEPPLPIYSESLIRTMTTGGMIMLTFTPMHGLTEVTQDFIENGVCGEPKKHAR